MKPRIVSGRRQCKSAPLALKRNNRKKQQRMATVTITLDGKSVFAKLKQVDEKFRPKYSIGLEPTPASLLLMKEHKLGIEEKEYDGLKFYDFKRYVDKNPDYKDSIGNLCGNAPKVVDKDKNPYNGLIGNGSDVTIKLDVYDTKYANKGHRLVAVMVNKLVEYVPQDGSGVDETEDIKPF